MSSSLALLRTRRLGPLCFTQACSALNDNLVKNALLAMALFTLGKGGAGLAAVAGALFILPYALLSAAAGQAAERFAKKRLLVGTKLFELALMAVAAAGFATGSVDVLLAVVLGLGVQAAALSPLKFGLIPELLAADEILSGNGVVEATTFLAILGGTIAGGALVVEAHGAFLVSTLGVAVASAGLVSSLFVPATPPAAPTQRIGWNLPLEAARLIGEARGIRPVWLCILGLSWFWTLGATLMAEFPVLVRDTLHGNAHVVTLLLTAFSVGVGAGSIGCVRLLRGATSARLVPFAAVGLAAFCWDFGTASSMGALPGLADVLGTAHGWRAVADLVLLGACGGVFSVPLYAIVQERSRPGSRARMIAANNVVNALAMVAGAVAVVAMSRRGLSPQAVLHAFAAATLLVAVAIVRILPQEVLRTAFRWYFGIFHGVEVRGLENYRAAGDRVVIVANHLSFADACLIACYLPDSPTFAVHTHTAAKWWARPFLSAVDIFKVDVQSPYAVKRMVEAVRDDGRKLMIFPEGRLTKTGALMKVYEGAGVVADRAHAKVLPISIEGLQFTRLGRMRGKLPMRWFPKLSVTVMPPVDLTPADAAAMTPRQRREAVGRALHAVLVDAVFRSRNVDRTLFSAFLDAGATFGRKLPVIEDVARSPLAYGRILLASLALGRALEAETSPGECVGLMLPNANATVVTMFGLLAFGRVVHPMNVSTGSAGMASICETVGIRTVVTSRSFVEKAKLGATASALGERVRILYLEDVRGRIGFAAKLRAKLDARRARSLPGAEADPASPAVVLATSGSEGRPKGVVLAHRNILANIAQLASVIDFTGGDRVFNAMPMFHSFGLTGGTLLPLLHGVRTFHYPSPLHYRVVPTLIYDTDATICFGTDTFLNGWAKYAHPYDFYAMRYIFAGAEKVRDETKRLFADRFGVRILEGYGATETAPALAMNTAMHCRTGTVGRMLPGIETRLEPVPGVEDGARLHVRGPNVMLGYFLPDAPGVLVPPAGGWYDTGDIVSVDADGYWSIRGRAKRFAKIAGEMVSMSAAEVLATSLWPDARHAVVNLPDPRKGEQIVLVTTVAGAEPAALLSHARRNGAQDLLVARTILHVDAMPLLATGKVDYPAVQRLAGDRVGTGGVADDTEEAA